MRVRLTANGLASSSAASQWFGCSLHSHYNILYQCFYSGKGDPWDVPTLTSPHLKLRLGLGLGQRLEFRVGPSQGSRIAHNPFYSLQECNLYISLLIVGPFLRMRFYQCCFMKKGYTLSIFLLFVLPIVSVIMFDFYHLQLRIMTNDACK